MVVAILVCSIIYFSLCLVSCCLCQYSFDGYVYEIFHSQTFTIDGSHSIDGPQLLHQLFGQNSSVKPWPMFLVLLAFVSCIRLMHWGIFTFDVFPFVAEMYGFKARKIQEPSPAGDVAI